MGYRTNLSGKRNMNNYNQFFNYQYTVSKRPMVSSSFNLSIANTMLDLTSESNQPGNNQKANLKD